MRCENFLPVPFTKLHIPISISGVAGIISTSHHTQQVPGFEMLNLVLQIDVHWINGTQAFS
jgi:hypothetical protein